MLNKIINKMNWKFKRIFLNIFWGIINICFLVWMTSKIIGSGWEIPWFFIALIYSSFYWILATIFFDAIIGDEFNGNS